MDANRKATGERFRKALRRQGGFTLIELVAVMAILAILVAVVAPAVTNTQRASVRAQAQADSQQVRNAANDFFKDQEESEVTIPHKVTVTATDDGASVTVDQQQRVSSRWPEIFITQEGTPPDLGAITRGGTTATSTADSKYSVVFPTASSTSDQIVVDVKLVTDATTLSIDGTAGLLQDFTAIDLDLLVAGGYLSQLPAAESRKSDTGVLDTGSNTLEVENFLWLFQKTDSSGGTDDAREIVVFELASVSQNELSGTNTVDLTYEQIQ